MSGINTNPMESADLFGGIKKKKKSKKLDLDLDLELEPEANESADASTAPVDEQDGNNGDDDDELNFGELKKKKKSKKKVVLDLDAFEKEIGSTTPDVDENEADAPTNVSDDEELGENPFAPSTTSTLESSTSPIESWQGTTRDYTYSELLTRIFHTLHTQNPSLSNDKKKFTMIPPLVSRDGSKKTLFANVIEICKKMHRHPDHVIQFLFAELGTIGSIDGSQRLIIRGRFQPKQIENVLRRYITEYVICKTCKRPETRLSKQNRIFFVTCDKCGSQRSVSAIKSGFQAQTGKRSKTRAAAGA